MNYPKISIVTVNYNLGDYLERTIKSVIDQKYPNLEYIIIDGGSIDNSVNIIKKYEDQLSYWVSEPDEGMYHAINKGFGIASGDILAWINSDDVYFKNSLFLVAEIFQNLNINWLTSNYAYVDEKDTVVYTRTVSGFNKFDFFLNDVKWIQQESTFWRRSLWEKAGGCVSVDYSLAADFELWSRFFQYDVLHVVSTSLSGFRVREKNQKSNEELDAYMKQVHSLRKLYKTKIEEIEEYKKINRIQRVMSNIPFSKYLLFKKYKQMKKELYKKPPIIKFNRNCYAFTTEENL